MEWLVSYEFEIEADHNSIEKPHAVKWEFSENDTLTIEVEDYNKGIIQSGLTLEEEEVYIDNDQSS